MHCNLGNDYIHDINKLYEVIEHLKWEAEIHESKTIKLVTNGKIETDYLRKCAEFVFRRTQQIIKIVPGKNRMETQQLASKRERKHTEKKHH